MQVLQRLELCGVCVCMHMYFIAGTPGTHMQQKPGEEPVVKTRARARSGSDTYGAHPERQVTTGDMSPQSIMTAAGLPELEPASRSRAARGVGKARNHSPMHTSAAQACGACSEADPAPEAPLSFPHIPGAHPCMFML